MVNLGDQHTPADDGIIVTIRNSTKRLTLATLLVAMTCAAPAFAKKPPNYCPPAGEEVPVAKALDHAFASRYVGCDITVNATFLKSGAAEVFSMVKTNGLVLFQVTAPGATAGENALTGASSGLHVGIAKKDADPIFALQPGDALLLRGGALFEQNKAINYAEAVFRASSVAKVEASPE